MAIPRGIIHVRAGWYRVPTVLGHFSIERTPMKTWRIIWDVWTGEAKHKSFPRLKDAAQYIRALLERRKSYNAESSDTWHRQINAEGQDAP